MNDRKNEDIDTAPSTATDAEGSPRLRRALLAAAEGGTLGAIGLARIAAPYVAEAQAIEALLARLKLYGVEDATPYIESARARSKVSMLSYRRALEHEVYRAAEGLPPHSVVMDKKRS